MKLTEEFKQELADRNPIADVIGQYVTLKRSGASYVGLCPFHNEKTPSFHVDTRNGLFYCFGCQKGGDVITFIEEQEHLDFQDAVRFLARRAGMQVPEDDEETDSSYRRKEQLWALNRDAARYFHSVLRSEAGEAGRAYLQKRGLSRKTITQFGLGFAPDSWDSLMNAMLKKGYTIEDLKEARLVRSREREIRGSDGSVRTEEHCYDTFRNRVIFPIIDIRGNVIAFGGRVMDNSDPKYLNSPESLIFDKGRNLFALNVAKKTREDYLILTEGYMDTISLHQYGFDCAVASLGTSLTARQAALIARYTKELILCYDSDAAGQRASQRAIGIFQDTDVNVKVLHVEGAKDPDEYLRKNGAEAFRRLIGKSEDQVSYQLSQMMKQYNLEEEDQKVAFTKEATAYLAAMPGAVEREVYAGKVSAALGVRKEAVLQEVETARRRLGRKQKQKQEKQNLDVVGQLRSSTKGVSYANVRSARAEEALLVQVMKENALTREIRGLTEESFSEPVYGRAYALIARREREGKTTELRDFPEYFTKDEMAAITRLYQQAGTALLNEKAIPDYVERIREEAAKRSGTDLRKAAESYRAKKGYGDRV